MTSRLGAVFLAVLCTVSPGCMGTIQSRVGPCGPQLLGFPLYSGIVTDLRVGTQDSSDTESEGGALLAFLSLPLDFVFDTVLFLPDLVAGAFGGRKIPFDAGAGESGEADPTAEPRAAIPPRR